MEIKLDNQQKKAVTYERGNLLVIAGPGAGKTRVIIERIHHLILNGVQPDRILAVTFTNKAADEIQERILSSIDGIKTEPVVSTFHSFALKVLREFHDAIGMKKHFSILDEEAQNEILKVLLKSNAVNPSVSALRRLKSHLDFETANLTYPFTHPHVKSDQSNEIQATFRDYRNFLVENNSVDFNDLILNALVVLQSDDEAKNSYRNRFDHVLLDEFQDINKAQYELVKSVIRDDATVLAVTDSDQMIYAWRGSNADLVKAFLHDFKAEMIELSKNYRSKDELVYAAKSVIALNKPKNERIIKIPDNLKPQIALLIQENEDDEANAIIAAIQSNIRRGYKYGDIGIIYRMHGFGSSIENELNAKGIPVSRVRSNDEITKERVNQLMSYLKLSQNLFDWDVKSAWDFPRRIMNPLEGYRLTAMARNKGISLYKLIRNPEHELLVSPLAMKRLQRFSKLIENMSILGDELSPSGYFQKLRRTLSSYLSPFNHSEEEKLIENLHKPSIDLESLAHKLLNKDSKPHLLILHTGGTMLHLCALMLADTLREYTDVKSQIAVAHSISETTWEKLSNRISSETPLLIIHLGSSDNSNLFLSEFWSRGLAFDLFELEPPFKGEPFLICLAAFRFLIDLLTIIPATPDERLLFYDLETTGIDTKRCEIIEVSALSTALKSDNVETFNSLIKPHSMPPPEVQELTGIKPAMLVDAPDSPEIIQGFDAFSRFSVIIGHNIENFDNPIMQRYFSKFLNKDFIPDSIDTLLWARELFPGKSNSLSALGERFGLNTDNLHRATEDVRLNLDVFYKLLEVDNIKRGLDFSKDAIIYMALMTLERDEPERGVGRTFINAAIRILANHELNYEIFQANLSKAFSDNVCNNLVTKIKMLEKESYPDDPERTRWNDMADYLSNLILHYEERRDPDNIAGFVNYYSLLKESDLIQDGNSVKMMTIHSSKGLEFPIVFISGLEQGSMPHYLAQENENRIQEERRLFYVAMTRAMEKIYLTYSQKRGGKFRPLSMFLKDIPDHLIEKYTFTLGKK